MTERPAKLRETRPGITRPRGGAHQVDAYNARDLEAFLFYGPFLGLMGQVGPTATLGISLAIFAAQIAWSHWWLARFRFGPMEWLWRVLTYGKLQPMPVREAAPTPVSATGS